MRTTLTLVFLIVAPAIFAQSRFMVGVSDNPNLTWGNYYSQQTNYNISSIRHSPQIYVGAGLNIGIYLSKRFFLLTGIEGTAKAFSYKDYYITYIDNAYDKYTVTSFSWEVPLLLNFILSKKPRRLSFFYTAGFTGGVCTSLSINKAAGVNSPPTSIIEIGNQIPNRYYLDFVWGEGCKANLSKKFSILIIPNFSYQITNLENMKLITFTWRTMLMYNF